MAVSLWALVCKRLVRATPKPCGDCSMKKPPVGGWWLDSEAHHFGMQRAFSFGMPSDATAFWHAAGDENSAMARQSCETLTVAPPAATIVQMNKMVVVMFVLS